MGETCATRHYEWNILDQPLASPMLWCITSMHSKYGCGLVDIGDNNLLELQGHCEKMNKSQSVWRTCKTFLTSVIGYSLGPLPHELKLILPSTSIPISLLIDSSC
jgi:hypothetical protein